MADEVPADVSLLLQDCIDGYEHLEALLLFVRAKSRTWTPAAVGSALNLPESDAAKALQDLERRGVLHSNLAAGGVQYQFRFNEPRLLETAKRLAVQYDTNRLAIIKLINANAIARVRSSAVRAFADAFVLGKKKDDA